MRAINLLCALALLIGSCATPRQKMEAWVGKHKSDLILKMGPPYHISEDGKGGQVFTYTSYRSLNIGDPTAWNVVKMFYSNAEGNIYYWRIQNVPVHPTQTIIKQATPLPWNIR